MSRKEQLMKLRDGRILEYATNSCMNCEVAVIFHHGTPLTLEVWSQWLFACETLLDQSKGILAVSYSRAGYGRSSIVSRSSIIDNNDDVEQLLNHLGITRFISIGWSGGGPFALASSLLPSCCGVITIASIAPSNKSDFNFLMSLNEIARDKHLMALNGEVALRGWMQSHLFRYTHMQACDVMMLQSINNLHPISMKFADDIAAGFRHAVGESISGWLCDEMCFVHDWGFDVSSIPVAIPCLIYHGKYDMSVTASHSRWLHSQIKHSTLTFLELDHMSIVEFGMSLICQELKVIASMFVPT